MCNYKIIYKLQPTNHKAQSNGVAPNHLYSANPMAGFEQGIFHSPANPGSIKQENVTSFLEREESKGALFVGLRMVLAP